MAIHLLRHGQTKLNASGHLRGRADIDLDATGREQAKALGRLFAGLPLRRGVAGPLKRVRRTAEPVARAAGVAIETAPALNDRDYGICTGALRVAVERRFGSVDAAPGVEPWEALTERLRATFLDRAATSHQGNIAVAGHDAVNRALLSTPVSRPGGDPGTIRQPTGCWNQLMWDRGAWRALILGAHPGDGRRP